MIFQQEKTPFQAVKTRSLKSRKVDIFPKGLTHGFSSNMAIFSTFLFLGNIGQENVFYNIVAQKNAFLGYKRRRTKIRTIDIFRTFFFQAIKANQMSFMIFSNQKTPFYAIKTKSSKSRKIDIFPKELTHGFGPKMAIFPAFFLTNIVQENVFYDILQRKNAFLCYKNKKFKQSKIDFFPKGLTHGFGPIMAIFQNFSFLSFMIFQNKKKRHFRL